MGRTAARLRRTRTEPKSEAEPKAAPARRPKAAPPQRHQLPLPLRVLSMLLAFAFSFLRRAGVMILMRDGVLRYGLVRDAFSLLRAPRALALALPSTPASATTPAAAAQVPLARTCFGRLLGFGLAFAFGLLALRDFFALLGLRLGIFPRREQFGLGLLHLLRELPRGVRRMHLLAALDQIRLLAGDGLIR